MENQKTQSGPRRHNPGSFLFFFTMTLLLSVFLAATMMGLNYFKITGRLAVAGYAAYGLIFLFSSILVYRRVQKRSALEHAVELNASLSVLRIEMETLFTFFTVLEKIKASENSESLNDKFEQLREMFFKMKDAISGFDGNISGIHKIRRSERRKAKENIAVFGENLQYLKSDLTALMDEFSAEYVHSKSLMLSSKNNMASFIYHLAVSMPILADFTNIFSEFSKDMILEVFNKFGEITNSSHRIADDIEQSMISLMDENKEDSLAYIIHKAHNLVLEFEGFYKNMDGLKTASDNFTEKSSEKLRNIQDIADSIEQIAETIKVLSLNVSIEAANTGAAGKGFQVLARDLREFTTTTMRFAHDVKSRVKDALITTESLKDNYQQSMEAVYRYMDEIKSSINSFEGIIQASFEKLKIIIENLRKFSINVDNGIKEVVSKLQYYDITSQEVDHLRQFFEKIFIDIYNSRSQLIDIGALISDEEKSGIKNEVLQVVRGIVTTTNERKILHKYEESFGIKAGADDNKEKDKRIIVF